MVESVEEPEKPMPPGEARGAALALIAEVGDREPPWWWGLTTQRLRPPQKLVHTFDDDGGQCARFGYVVDTAGRRFEQGETAEGPQHCVSVEGGHKAGSSGCPTMTALPPLQAAPNSARGACQGGVGLVGVQDGPLEGD